LASVSNKKHWSRRIATYHFLANLVSTRKERRREREKEKDATLAVGGGSGYTIHYSIHDCREKE
jgi:hypothetical protein